LGGKGEDNTRFAKKEISIARPERWLKKHVQGIKAAKKRKVDDNFSQAGLKEETDAK